jgi:hypothetical protein
MWLTVIQAASADLFRAFSAHEGLPTAGSEKNNVIRLRFTALHTGRSHGHTRDGQSGGGRSFFQKPSYGNCRYVSFQDISIDLGGVARGEIGRHSKPMPNDLKVGGLLDCDGEARGLKMLHPTRAAPAIWILVNEDTWTLGEDIKRRHDQRRHGYPESASPRQTARMINRLTIHGLGLEFPFKSSPSRCGVERTSV